MFALGLKEGCEKGCKSTLSHTTLNVYSTKVKLFQHWKGSENTIRAAEVALDIGKSFKLLGMNLHSIKVYEDAIDMWKMKGTVNDEDIVAGAYLFAMPFA
jgi:hypothetical protein